MVSLMDKPEASDTILGSYFTKKWGVIGTNTRIFLACCVMLRMVTVISYVWLGSASLNTTSFGNIYNWQVWYFKHIT